MIFYSLHIKICYQIYRKALIYQNTGMSLDNHNSSGSSEASLVYILVISVKCHISEDEETRFKGQVKRQIMFRGQCEKTAHKDKVPQSMEVDSEEVSQGECHQ